MEKKIATLEIQEKKHINILLLGETGVGKSTLINAMGNYMHYKEFNKALTEPPMCLIPSMFHITDVDGNVHEVRVGEISPKDDNECLNLGQSATQDVKTYVFPLYDGSTLIRLIDTPGMLDPRGVEQDDENCENILSYISNLHELHAICFLFKPNDSRITYTFEYCFKQILSRLDKSAAQNILFIFTNAKGTNYQPGETFALLKKLVKDIELVQRVKIPIDKNVFFFENEAFRYVAAVKQGLKLLPTTKQDYAKSWDHTYAESWKLLKYIFGDQKTPSLKPHMVRNSTSINEARSLINKLGQPLLDISQLIAENLRILERRQKELSEKDADLMELSSKLYVPVINIRAVKVDKPITVCKDLKCAENFTVDDQVTWNYKQRCHEPCYLKNVPQNVIGAPQLAQCAAMDPTTQTCKMCGCPQTIHLHVYYLTEKFDDKKIDKTVQSKILSNETIVTRVKGIVQKINQKKIELEEEKKEILDCAVRFASFLKNNAITPINDAYRKYLAMIIENAKYSDKDSVPHLQSLLNEYDEIKRAFDNVSSFGASSFDNTAKEVTNLMNKLYSLKHNGKKIRELFESQKVSRRKEFKKSEYTHSSLIEQKKKSDPSVKKDGTNENKSSFKKNFKKKMENSKTDMKASENQSNVNFHRRNRTRNNQKGGNQSSHSNNCPKNDQKPNQVNTSNQNDRQPNLQNLCTDHSKQQSNCPPYQNKNSSHHYNNNFHNNQPRPFYHNHHPTDYRYSYPNPPPYYYQTPYSNHPPHYSSPYRLDNRPVADNRSSNQHRPPYSNRSYDNYHPSYDNRPPHNIHPSSSYNHPPPYSFYPNDNHPTSYNRSPVDNYPAHEIRPPCENCHPRGNCPTYDYDPSRDNAKIAQDGKETAIGYQDAQRQSPLPANDSLTKNTESEEESEQEGKNSRKDCVID